MTVHRPSVGVLMPLPAKDNDLGINKLHLVLRSADTQRKVSETGAAGTGVSCVSCEVAFTILNGYVGPRGEFYCDDCIGVLADNGEFL